MPVANIHVLEGRYDEARLNKVSKAVQDALMNALGVPPDDFFQITYCRGASSGTRLHSWA